MIFSVQTKTVVTMGKGDLEILLYMTGMEGIAENYLSARHAIQHFLSGAPHSSLVYIQMNLQLRRSSKIFKEV